MKGHSFQNYIIQQIATGDLKPWSGQLFAVGGFVRDELFGRDSLDYDLVVVGIDSAESIAKILKTNLKNEITEPLKLGEHYPIWSFEFKQGPRIGLKVDIAESQKEMFPKAEQRTRMVQPGTFAEDIQRRDFTMNMLARDLSNGQLIDESGSGVQDIQDRILRSHPKIDAHKIMSDDPLRMVRAIRFCHTHGLILDSNLIGVLQTNAYRISILSVERILGELKKVANPHKLGDALLDFDKLGMIKYIFDTEFEIEFSIQTSRVAEALNACIAGFDEQIAVLFSFFSQKIRNQMFDRFKIGQKNQNRFESVYFAFEQIKDFKPTQLRPMMRRLGPDFFLLKLLVSLRGPERRIDFYQFESACSYASLLPVFDKPQVRTEFIVLHSGRQLGPELGEAIRATLEFEDSYVIDFGRWPTEVQYFEFLSKNFTPQ